MTASCPQLLKQGLSKAYRKVMQRMKEPLHIVSDMLQGKMPEIIIISMECEADDFAFVPVYDMAVRDDDRNVFTTEPERKEETRSAS